MRIDASFKADIVNYGLVYDHKEEKRTATICLGLYSPDSKQCAAVFGDGLSRLAFVETHDHGVDYAKMTPKATSEAHWVELLGLRLATAPVLGDIKKLKGIPGALITLKLPTDATRELGAAIHDAFGETVEVKIYPQQEVMFAGKAP